MQATARNIANRMAFIAPSFIWIVTSPIWYYDTHIGPAQLPSLIQLISTFLPIRRARGTFFTGFTC